MAARRAGKLFRVLSAPLPDPLGVTTPACDQISLCHAKKSMSCSWLGAIALNATSGSMWSVYIADIAPMIP